MTLAFTHETRAIDLDQFTQQLHTELAWSGFMAEPKVRSLPIDTPVIDAESETEALEWHADGIAVWTERQSDQWSDGILVYRWATRTDGDRCIVTWPVSHG